MENNNQSEEQSTEVQKTEDTPVEKPVHSGPEDQKEEQKEDGTRFKEGDEVTLIRVRFPGNSRSFAFLRGSRTYRYGEKVVAMSDRGMDVGYINSFAYTVKFTKDLLPLRHISKIATQEDIENKMQNVSREKEAELHCVELVEKLKLDMNVTHVEIIQFGKKMVFYFTAPSRVDFRELVKQLVAKLKMRIELRQISVRDRAAALGSIGACGLSTCCSTFLKNYGNVSIKMAKNQNLALIPSKINGTCGQLKCCIKYEDEVYSNKRNFLPKENSLIQTKNGDKGKVNRLHILAENFDMLTDKGQIRRYRSTQWNKNHKLPDSYKFPDRFDHIVNETSTIIGTEAHIIEQEKLSDEEKAKANLEALEGNSDLFDVFKDNDSQNENPSGPQKQDNKENPKENPKENQEERTKEKNDRRNNRNRRNRNNKNKKYNKRPQNNKGGQEKSNNDAQKDGPKKKHNKRHRPRKNYKKNDGNGNKPQD